MHLHSFISASGAYPNLERTFFLEVSFLLWRHALICRRIVSALRPFHALFFNYLPNFCGDVKGKWAGQVEWVPIIGIGLLMSQHCCVNLPGQCCGQWTMDGGHWMGSYCIVEPGSLWSLFLELLNWHSRCLMTRWLQFPAEGHVIFMARHFLSKFNLSFNWF